VADAQEVERAVGRLRELAGGDPEIVVNGAGVFSLHPVDGLPADEVREHLAVNLEGSMSVVRSTLPALLRNGRGTLILLGSVAGRKAFPGNAAYSASKYGLRGFHEVLLEELRGSGVRATLLEPSATDTPLWDPLDPDRDPQLPNRSDMLRPEEVAEAVLFVATRPEGVRIPFLPIERG
jgi:NADP-dependent 3-hydroxy acid dehydrogenase YdfG